MDILGKYLKLLTFALTLLIFGACNGRGSGNFDNLHSRKAIRPEDYPHHDEAFDAFEPSTSARKSMSRPAGQGQGSRVNQRGIFLSDRVVRGICKSLATFAKTGVAPVGRLKRSSEDAGTEPSGWWRSIPCATDDVGDCGFEWVESREIESGDMTGGEPAEESNRVNRKSSGVPGDESELNLQLPSSAEWNRRSAAMANSTKDED